MERTPVEHHLKTHPKFFLPVRTRAKKLEIRKNDRDFQVGDILVLEEWDPGFNPKLKEVRGYTGNAERFRVTHVLPLLEVPDLKALQQLEEDTTDAGCTYVSDLEKFVAMSIEPA